MSSSNTAAASVAIRADPDPVKRFSKKALAVLLGGASALVLGAFAFALRSPPPEDVNPARELYSTVNKPTADGLSAMPATYADIPPELGPRLPGDLGAAVLKARDRAGVSDKDVLSAAPTQTDVRLAEAELELALREAKLAETARTSTVFFKTSARPSSVRDAAASSSSPPLGSGNDALAQLTALTRGSIDQGTFVTGQGGDPNRQDRKIDFASAEVESSIYNPFRVQEPISSSQLMAGSIIPASLITGINSDLPGQVIAQVTEHVYDTVTGETLLIPQGARLIGRYDSIVAFGQSRALLVWTRIIMPDGSSIQVDSLPGVDGRGQAGLKDRVDQHNWQLARGIALSTLLGVGAELASDGDDDITRAITESVQGGVNRAGQRIVERELGVQPTLTIRPGWRFSIIAHQDIILRPYRGD